MAIFDDLYATAVESHNTMVDAREKRNTATRMLHDYDKLGMLPTEVADLLHENFPKRTRKGGDDNSPAVAA